MKKRIPVSQMRAIIECRSLHEVVDEGWMAHALSVAHAREEIIAYEVLTSLEGPYGVQLVVFTVDVMLSREQLENPELYFTAIITQNLISMGESDPGIDIRWVGRGTA